MPIIGGVNLGNLTDYLFLFADGSDLAAWLGPSNGYIGNVAVTGSANQIHGPISFAYAGNIQANRGTFFLFGATKQKERPPVCPIYQKK